MVKVFKLIEEFKHRELVECSRKPFEQARYPGDIFVRPYAGLINGKHHVYRNKESDEFDNTYSVEYVRKPEEYEMVRLPVSTIIKAYNHCTNVFNPTELDKVYKEILKGRI